MDLSLNELPGPACPGGYPATSGYALGWAVNRANYCSEPRNRHPAHVGGAHRGAQGLAVFRRSGRPAAAAWSAVLRAQRHGRIQRGRNAMGIRSEHDLFGGVVPLPYVATKAISHALHGAGAAAARRVGRIDGSRGSTDACCLASRPSRMQDARRPAASCCAGSVRVKPVRATGGNGQTVVRNAHALDRTLRRAWRRSTPTAWCSNATCGRRAP